VAGGGIGTLAGTMTGTLETKVHSVIHGKKVNRLSVDGSEAYPLELERKGILPKGK
jgi:hypothetical protein